MKSIFKSKRILQVGSRLGMLCALLFAARCGAQSTNILSSFGTAIVDGIFAPGEWDNAATIELAINVPEGSTTPGRIYLMNDQTNLYLAVRLERAFIDQAASAAFYFNNGDGGTSLGPGDDGIVFDVWCCTDQRLFDIFFYTNSSCPPSYLCSDYDVNAGGRNDGAGGFSNNGIYSFFELSHPLNSGDSHDISLAAGQTIGCWPFVRLLNATNYADTFPDMLTILIASPPNHPPVAHINLFPVMAWPGRTNLVAIAPGGSEATLVLDGSSSNDPDGDALSYSWNEGPLTIGFREFSTNVFGLGTHTVGLAVSDSIDTGAATATFDVVAPNEPVEWLMALVESSGLPVGAQRPLLATLRAGASAFQRRDLTAGAQALRAFQHQALAQLGASSPVLARALVEVAGQIVNALMQEQVLQGQLTPHRLEMCL